MKLEKISNYALYAISAVIVVCFLLFWFIGTDNYDDNGNKAPMFTDLIMILMYLLGVVTFVLMIWSLVKGVQNTAGTNELETTGIPGKKITLGVCVLTVVSLVIGTLLGIGEKDFTSTSGVFTPGWQITMVDAFMWSMYILFIVSVIAVVIAASGVFTKTATKK